MPASINQLLVILAVRDVARARAFYRAVFDWPMAVDLPVYVEFQLPGGRRVGIYQREGYAVNTGVLPLETPEGAITPAELYFVCDSLEDAMAAMQAAGARKLADPAKKPWGDVAAYYADPDGNVIVIAHEADDHAD